MIINDGSQYVVKIRHPSTMFKFNHVSSQTQEINAMKLFFNVDFSSKYTYFVPIKCKTYLPECKTHLRF